MYGVKFPLRFLNNLLSSQIYAGKALIGDRTVMGNVKKRLHELTIEQKIEYLEPLLERIRGASNVHDKIEILNKDHEVEVFLEKPSSIRTFLNGLTPDCELAIKSILALGQGPIVFNQIDKLPNKFESLRELLSILLEVEKFYENIGGIIGYHITVLRLMANKQNSSCTSTGVDHYSKPPGIQVSEDTDEVRKAVAWGVKYMPRMAEIYPVGGAGDRLKLCDDCTGEMLPAAQLPFGGRTLLEGLIRDLQAREYLYYKIYGKQLTTPIAMMTSHEKDNHVRIGNICKSKKWFGRPEDSFRLFIQPLVPVIGAHGNWSLHRTLKLNLKPGGHGAIWKRAWDEKIFEWLETLKRDKALLRQINNPIAGTDKGLLAFTGIGCAKNKSFGFASCFRLLKASEGMIVLMERETEGSHEYCITNIEYTDFQTRGIQDVPDKPGSLYSAFPANTNILFVDIETIKEVLNVCTIPGMLINMKSTFPCIDADGTIKEIKAGRLESTMQNIADHIVDKIEGPLDEGEYEKLRTYVTYNERRDTISVTKNSYAPGKPLQETPEGCFYDMHLNSHELLGEHCGFEVPQAASEEEYLSKGPSFLFRYHPALGPVYTIIGQKVRKGKLAERSDFLLEASEVDVEGLELNGSLHIIAEAVMGHETSGGLLNYSERGGKCELKNVRVSNKGIDWEADNIFWKDKIKTLEVLKITLQGNAEFYAKDVTFEGKREIMVPDGHRIEAYQKDGKIELKLAKIGQPSWQWKYSLDEDNQIKLSR